MKKYLFTESQIKKVVDYVIKEQSEKALKEQQEKKQKKIIKKS